ncbi:bifunctional aspartate kinase/homoserine dehydrogenase I [Persicimonas caeni]|uniref:Bifunctional aspartate kinase/homoserine dehydrogenase I n=1 Tax=Persicimonas caeni TaxID=2292766 RepID=A0A4Y6PR86_PERCE|nr:bifunctional aspartate kinase/homoserine dehydrogenase I [Persicimonas caeni]QDG50760.1 bifunctional aspartate kinase/homoserine dehydrogenase I [Persicimonas caeni]QED31981.1 bifunctional aspartate kinase/homoserine dehydrogenase I [Persicimonas caeni]
MSYRVLKFGGSSLGAAPRLSQVVDLIVEEREESPLAVVCSAMGDTTDWLLEAVELAAGGDLDGAEALVDRIADLATSNALVVLEGDALEADGPAPASAPHAQITPVVREMLEPLRKLLLGISLLREKTEQSLDLVLSFGERLSATIVAELVAARGVEATFVDARDWVVTDATFGSARVDWEASKARLDALREGWGDAVPIHTGFLGQTPDGRTTTLGRNGSDYTATLLGRGLDADEVVICTDVSGVMTADPFIVDDAYPVASLSYLEALELANYGARMFHNRTMLPLIESGIPMRIRNTMDPDEPGTRIDALGVGEGDQPTCVTSLENLALVDLRWRELSRQAQMGRRVLRAFEEAGVTVWMATQAAHGQAVSVVVPVDEVERAKAAIEEAFAWELERGEVEPVDVRRPVTLLSLVAEKMRDSHNIAGKFFQSLGAVGIKVLAIAQGESSRSISCVIDAADTEVAVRTVHAAFNFAHQEVNLFVMGCGVVGSELLGQIRSQQQKLEREHDVDVRVVGLSNSRRITFDPAGLELDGWSELLDADAADELHSEPNSPEALERMLDKLTRLSVPILVDVTAAGGMEALYEKAFERGVHVVAANKKPVTASLDDYAALMASARKNHRAYHYETTVGASLPVVDTLQNLVRTGDRVMLVEGSFSGTLGYLTNEVMAGVPLSEAIRTAKELGYTEPNPQDDLSGLDVARKALILARELGLDLELDDIAVEPLVPQRLLETDTLDEFFAALEDYDEEFSEQIATIKAEDKTLRYLAVIDPGVDGAEPRFQVGPVAIEASHPATRLRGSESFVAFTTERYQDYPLIVQGAGAGGAVTAAGVLSDVLRISQNLRGR